MRISIARIAALAPVACGATACAGHNTPRLELSREPRGSDLSLLPVAFALQERPASVALQLTKPAYVTIFDWPQGADSLHVVYSSVSDSTTTLDGTPIIHVASPTRRVLAADGNESLVRESCVVVQRNVGDRGLPICGTTSAGANAAPIAAWRFTRPLILLVTGQPFRGANVVAADWFLRVDGVPPTVLTEWGAMPFGAPMLARKP